MSWGKRNVAISVNRLQLSSVFATSQLSCDVVLLSCASIYQFVHLLFLQIISDDKNQGCGNPATDAKTLLENSHDRDQNKFWSISVDSKVDISH